MHKVKEARKTEGLRLSNSETLPRFAPANRVPENLTKRQTQKPSSLPSIACFPRVKATAAATYSTSDWIRTDPDSLLGTNSPQKILKPLTPVAEVPAALGLHFPESHTGTRATAPYPRGGSGAESPAP